MYNMIIAGTPSKNTRGHRLVNDICYTLKFVNILKFLKNDLVKAHSGTA